MYGAYDDAGLGVVAAVCTVAGADVREVCVVVTGWVVRAGAAVLGGADVGAAEDTVDAVGCAPESSRTTDFTG